MSRQQTRARFNLAVCLTAVVLTLGLYPFVGSPAVGALGLMGLLGLGPLFFRSRPGSQEVLWDEREREIQLRASIISYSIFWVVFVAANMTLWAVYRKDGAVPVIFLPIIVFGGWLLFTVIQSIITLTQYRGGDQDGAA